MGSEIRARSGKTNRTPLTSRQSELARPLSADHCVIACRAMDETYIRVGGKWRYVWRAIDADGQPVDLPTDCAARFNLHRQSAHLPQSHTGYKSSV
ncbi:MAG: DDE-type integrase/transposase/recombinase [Sulfitobacter sp.]